VWQLGHSSGPAKLAESNPQTLSLAGILQQRIWWWLLIGTLAALLLETLWTGARRERATEPA